MDSQADSLLAVESARPFFHYRAYYPHQRAYTRLLEAFGPDDLLVPSPLLDQDSAVVLLHYQQEADGQWTSPEVPTGNLRDLAESTGVDGGEIDNRARLLGLISSSMGGPATKMATTSNRSGRSDLGGTTFGFAAGPQAPTAEPPHVYLATAGSDAEEDASEFDAFESQSHDGTYQVLGEVDERSIKELEARQGLWMANVAAAQEAQIDLGMTIAPEAGDVKVTVFQPEWVDAGGPSLVYNRNVTVAEDDLKQGFLIDFPVLSTHLLDEINDLFPDARLRPLVPGADLPPGAETRRMATLPALLEVHRQPELLAAGLTPMRSALLVAWLAVAAVITAVGLTLRSIIAYSQRRARFASAVTHELRTPLTTFQMYSELLDEGLVTDEETRRDYHRTLRKESGRLARLVENVLAYARLEDGRHVTERESLDVTELVDRLLPALSDRAAAASIEFHAPERSATPARLSTSPEIVEQILGNLVDNACKYGTPPIEFHAREQGSDLWLEISDDGPGVPVAVADRIFEPFDRGTRQGGDPSAGVGLGLALSRELARDIGGNLVMGDGPRTLFRLVLPIQQSSP